MTRTLGSIQKGLRLTVIGVLLAGLLSACTDVAAPEPVPEPAAVAAVAVAAQDGATGGMLNIGDTLRLTATPFAADGRTLSGRATAWQTSDAAVATVTTAGVVTARGAGSVRISATIDTKVGEHWLHVATGPAQVAEVRVSPAAAVVEAGETLQYLATALDAAGNEVHGRDVTWTAEPTGRVSISATGLVTALAPGYAQIRATIEGVSVGVGLTITEPTPVDFIFVSPASAAVLVGLTIQLTAVPMDLNNNPLDRPVTWTSENPNVAMVGTSGLVLGVGSGDTHIVASAGGVTSRVSIQVRQIPTGPVITYDLVGTSYNRVPFIQIGTTTWTDGDGAAHDAFMVVRGGRFRINTTTSTYEQTLEVATYLTYGQPGQSPVRVRNVTDRGDVLYDVFTGYWIFQSKVKPGSWFKVESAGATEFVAPQSVEGTAPQPWVWGLE